MKWFNEMQLWEQAIFCLGACLVVAGLGILLIYKWEKYSNTKNDGDGKMH